MVGQFDHRAKAYVAGRGRTAVWADLDFEDPAKAISPQWRVPREAIPANVQPRIDRYRLGFCDVASPTNERTLVAALLPPGVVSGHKVPTILLDDGSPADYLLWLAVANSLVMDYLVRRKVSLSMSYTILDSLPFPRLAGRDEATREVVQAAARLTCVSPDMYAFWDLLASDGWVPNRRLDTIPGVVARSERADLRARLDAQIAVDWYDLTIAEIETVLADFKALANRERREYGEFRTRRLVLAEFGRLVGDEHRKSNRGMSPVRQPRPAEPHVRYPEAAPRAFRRAAESTGPAPTATRRPSQATLAELTRAAAGSAGWLPEEAVDLATVVPARHVRHRRFGEGVVIEVRRTVKPPTVTIRFGASDDREIAIGYGLLEFDAE